MRSGSVLLLSIIVAANGCSKDPATRPAETADDAQQASASNSAPRAPDKAVVFNTDAGEVRVAVEVVSTPGAIQKGLMYRKHLAPDHGMLFIFPDESVRSFWMKNTLIPLDMIFVRGDGSVAGIVENAEPLTLQSRSVGIPTRYVVEVNGGFTREHGIAAGSNMTLEGIEP